MIGTVEHDAVRRRLLRTFPGMTTRWAYCAACLPLVEDLLAAATGDPAAVRRPAGEPPSRSD
jgi:hypothetical protein